MIHEVAERIRDLTKGLTYDHRTYLPLRTPGYNLINTEAYRANYACFKYAVAAVIQPAMILEIGIQSGVSSFAFLAGCHSVKKFIGIDNEQDDKALGTNSVQNAVERLREKCKDFIYLNTDSQDMIGFPVSCTLSPYLVHIDGNHSREGVAHDLVLALRAGADWILLDDAKAESVMAGFYDVFDLYEEELEVENFPETHNGDLLVRRAS